MNPAAPDLGAGITALEAIIELGEGRVQDGHVAEAQALRVTIDERLALGDGVTVVAVVGGTGVGKSALVNRLVGMSVADEGVRRPTTSRPLAVTAVEPAVGDALLDWLAIDDRVVAPPGLPEGLVLVDVPDHDSVVATHRETAARLAGRVDGLIVVVDPVKYARADLYDGPLAALTDHAEVVIVVLNRIDELPADEVARCLADLEGRLEAGPHTGLTILATSAATGEGLEALRAHLRDLVEARSAAYRRLAADTSALARRVAADLVTLPDPVPETARLLDALMDATDAHRIVAEAQMAYRRDARRAVRSPLARAVLLPLRGVASVAAAFGLGEAKPGPGVPAASAARIEAVLGAELRLHDTTGRAHARLGDTIEHLVTLGAPALADSVGGVGVRPDPRRWWRWAAAVRGVLELVALIGFVWLALLGLGDWLRLPEIPTPYVVGAVSWPTALLIGGLVLRMAVGLLTRLMITRGSRRHRDQVAGRIRQRLATEMRQRLLTPYAEELARQHRLQDAVRVVVPVSRA